jgi:hypothetical protein
MSFLLFLFFVGGRDKVDILKSMSFCEEEMRNHCDLPRASVSSLDEDLKELQVILFFRSFIFYERTWKS